MNPELVAFLRARLSEERDALPKGSDHSTLVYGAQPPRADRFHLDALDSMVTELEQSGDPAGRGISERERYKRAVLVEQILYQATRWKSHPDYLAEWAPQ